MTQNRITFIHTGDKTVIQTPLRPDSLERFKQGLKENDFIIEKDRAFRKSHLTKNDWPIQITFSPQEDFFELTASMYIPLRFFIVNVSALMVVPPMMWFLLLPMKLGLFFEFTILYFLFIFVIFNLIFRGRGAKPKQLFDLSPKDSWQHVPRKKWNGIIKNLLEKNFKVMVDESEG